MTRVLGALLLLVAASCGGSGGGGSSSATQLSIVTQALADGNVGRGYFQSLRANGGQSPYTWSVSQSGDPIPLGLALSTDGVLSGAPQQPITATLLIVVRDAGATTVVASFGIEVRDIEISGATQGPVTPGSAFSLSASGGVPTYTFSLQANQSGGSLTSGGVYTAGQSSGIDIVRATDRDGFFEEVNISVGDDPFVGFTAAWGTTDVWWIDWDVVYDPSPSYSADFDEVLVALGLRQTASTGSQGTEADQLAKLLMIRCTLGWMSQYYGNNDDGSPAPGGLSISFVGPDPPSGGTTPGVGGVVSAAPNRYGTICVRYGATAGVVGTAWLDDNNDSIEHDCGNPSGTPLGVFANRVLTSYLATFNNSIAGQPVGSSDVASLRAMLLGRAPSNSREQAIWNVTNGYARVLAAVLAHEVGHSLGLYHSSPSAGPGDLMNTSLNVGPSVSYAFNSTHWSLLMTNLPGPNR